MQLCARCKALVVSLVVCFSLAAIGLDVACAQQPLVARLLPHGAVSVTSGEKPVATLSLNAHGPEWQHADQSEATAVVRQADPGPGWLVQGTLPVPKTDEGAIRFVETISPQAKGLLADYILGPTKALTLNGLQVSLLLPMETFAGKTIAVHTRPTQATGSTAQPEGKAQEIALPDRLDQGKWQLFTGPASRVEIAAGSDTAITLVPGIVEPVEGEATSPEFVIQDLRKCDRNLVEVRLFLAMEDKGKFVSAWDKMHLALEVIFARDLRWQ